MIRPILLFLLALAAPAVAQSGGTATLGTPAKPRGAIVANGMVWHCAGATCTGGAGGYRVADQRTCKDLARQVGRIATFTVGGEPLSADDLAACNAHAKAG